MITDTLFIIPSSFIGRFSPVLISRCMLEKSAKFTCPLFGITGGFRNNFSSYKRLSEEDFKERFLEFVSVFIKESRNFLFKFLHKEAAKNLKTHRR
jgi:hypothetical protein